MKNRSLNVEVHTERLHKTMQVLEERYRNTGKEPIHTQLLKIARYMVLMYYGQQEKVNAIIKSDKLPDGSGDRLENMKHNVLYSPTEATIRAAAKVQENRLHRLRNIYKSNVATHSLTQNTTTTVAKRHKPDNGALRQTKPTGQPQEKKEAREKTCTSLL
ncbi:hypothetical protein SARC_00393 [Sphaeroforma arctica JP610]|uniref:Uncharacterized protein n=1 Tax=Sphaeroforma arctica JP610 TaxID=667725 RepID=A0A0L0GGP7_9EUKA|nr:hypothetical protein SARC_00393 [Sphaeroforma arctica JP610]KNC87508.1 hypothetical protein SARC_00393 [Sphaeroforma arctica JP610]|eukprot:XP_014161410.1 hypothetical protein SARC_00393 [Sphaeroforma arctica JP610]